MKNKTQKRGAVLLIAILVSSVALAVGFGVYNRTYKELLFASYWKQTQVAFSSADAGLECALYWELHPPVGNTTFFPTFLEPAPGPTPTNDGSFSCFDQSFSWTLVGVPTGGIATSTFSSTSAGGCVVVEVVKNSIATTTMITARGYNDACTSTNPRRVERGLKVGL